MLRRRLRFSTKPKVTRATAALEEPIRAELFGVERLEQHAESLATAQPVVPREREEGRALTPRVRDNGRVLLEAYRAIAEAIHEQRAITPAAEWLVDNFHIVDEQLREIRDDLPHGFYRELPKLADGPLAGYPRVFGIAWAYVAHTDSRFDPETLRRFVRAYQRVQPLTIGELWAVAITLRIVLVENLRRLAERIVQSHPARDDADRIADSLLGLGGRTPEPPLSALRRLERGPLARAFVVELVQRLHDQDPAVTPALAWLDARLAEQGTTADQLVQLELESQTSANVTVRNIITSMRLISSFEWADFFESVSLVDEVLRAGSAFAAMDFTTRDHYRHAIEQLARASGRTELEVAEQAIQKAIRARAAAHDAGVEPGGRDEDPGYYLISIGRRAFERELGFRVSAKRHLLRGYGNATPVYIGMIALLTGGFVLPLVFDAVRSGFSWLAVVPLGLLALFPASDLAVALVNRAVTALIKPRVLPRLELRDGVPASLRTIVVMPTMLTTREIIEQQVDQLEIHYLANPDGDLYFALLSDWTDATVESAPDDEELVAFAVDAIGGLNRRHGAAPGGGERFLFLHRRRVWNEREGKWMGWERKRGKLHELNRLLRGATDTTFLALGGTIPKGVRYVTTLDADTRLPRGAAYRLIGTMAHPLNRPFHDRHTRRVVEGYAILQPRVTPTLPTGRGGSFFQRIFSGPAGIDPYAAAVSDVYQDLFREGSYTGKGIYDVDAFETALAGRIPDNALLSHDLFEGTFARAGLVTDIELFEEFPAHYEVAAARQHRWARGDWQLLPWILQRRSAIPLIGRWKMLDNLRRSLSAPASFLALVVGWTVMASPVPWTGFVLATIGIPAFLPFLIGLVPRRSGIAKRSHVRAVGRDFVIGASHMALAVTLLAHQAWLMSDAIARTIVRLYVTRRKLLEWTTAAQAKASADLSLGGYSRHMIGALILAGVVALVVVVRPSARPFALPFVLLWTLSPLVAWSASLPRRLLGRHVLDDVERRALRAVGRRTWRFFETFVDAENHALPPDNFQEDPKAVVAHRTSPTNIGLYLLSVVAARDFGWIGTHDAATRLEATLATLETLERFRGHFYNWYDTRTLRPLDPQYVSSVDSGNLVGHLIVLANACRELVDRPVLGGEILAGIEDTILLARESAERLARDGRTQTVSRKHLDEALDEVLAALAGTPATPHEWSVRLGLLADRVDTVIDIVRTLADGRRDGAAEEVLVWSEAARATIASHGHDLALVHVADGNPGHALPVMPVLGDVPERATDASEELRKSGSHAIATEVEGTGEASRSLVRQLTALARRAERLVAETDFAFLLDPTRGLFAVGYRVADGSLDPSCYDLLASEARLTSFVAIAKGDVPVSHWLKLGRPLTPVEHGAALVSWSGSMFEYLMPSLVMRAPANSLLEQTALLVVRRQIQYGIERGVPWGVSESAFHARDLELTYQYSSFGVPGLGLKRGLSDDVVIAPYATMLAAMVDPVAAVRNLARLDALGGRGPFGFYEALDFTAARVPEGERAVIVRAYMAHHQGMSLVAIANVLHNGVMRVRFHAAPAVQATELLLQERTPRDVAVARPRAEEVEAAAYVRELAPSVLRRFTSPHDPSPHAHLLSNGRYSVMVTAAGSGFSRFRDVAVTRWREDATRDCWGTYVFLRDAASGDVWSAGYQPTGVEPDRYEVTLSEDRVEIVRRDGAILTTLEIVVSPEDDAEVRRVSVGNLGVRAREIELTSYAELVLAPLAADTAHPAFSNLFVHTEFVHEIDGVLAMRRPRADDEAPLFMAHVVTVEGETIGGVQFETDRARFLGRGRSIRTPMSVIDGRPLSNTVGSVLDPIASLRRRIRLAPGATTHVTFSTLVAPSRDAALALADKYHDPATFERVLTAAWTQAQVELHHLGIAPDQAHLFQRLADRILFAEPTLRASSEVLKRNARNARALWAYGISGDLPIVLARIDKAEDIQLIRHLLRAHQYWRRKQVAVDLVILNEKASSYAGDLHALLEGTIRASQAKTRSDDAGTQGKVFLLRADLVTAEDHTLLQAAARALLLSHRGSLAEQVLRAERTERSPSARERALVRPAPRPTLDVPPLQPALEFANGLGGFASDGKEYVTILGEGQWTPAPWINVIANASFGFLVSESGAGYTWAANSRDNQLTQWSNDPVSDPPGEAIYVRDEESGELWNPTVLPIREEHWPYVAVHGQGYSRFEHTSHEISLTLLQLVPLDDPIKISRLAIENHSGRTRRLSVTAYVEWVLGFQRASTTPFVVTEIDAETGAMLARNPWNADYGGQVAFADLGGLQDAWTADRREFLGRNGTLDHPAALERNTPLSGRVGAGLDPCAALQTTLEIRPGARVEIVFLLGAAASREAAVSLVATYRAIDVDSVLRAVTRFWDDVAGALQVSTPDRSMDLLLNRWLLYQTLACRIWSRAAFYQAGAAYGFRDQLQDVLAITVAKRELTRAHLLRAAARQFREGDVQHWWHVPSGRGVRTRISDDRVWLPYAVNHYVEVTGDVAVLDEVVPFLEGRSLEPDEAEAYFEPAQSHEQASLFEHCARALDRSLEVGRHGLPLIGTGDWNDGMNRVGHGGKGESVWLAWFLHTTLWEFAKRAEARGEDERAARWRRHVHALKDAIEREAWDGDWYRRAYFDDGTPLGSAANTECRIDSIAQSWGVISGAADPARGARAMAAVEEYLVRRGDGLVLLFTPPFDRMEPSPGYIKGYVPGVRENGGQYTHAAIWSVLAFAALGDGDKAGELFSILNPINHASTRAGIHRYKVEPYVAAADICSEPPHVGRGGWTWYTGSAGWMYRAGVEWILGFRLRGTRLFMDPCIPRAWRSFGIAFRYHSARYEITIENPRNATRGVSHVELDGVVLAGDGSVADIPLVDDGAAHRVRLVLG